jgi:hypothetical protein
MKNVNVLIAVMNIFLKMERRNMKQMKIEEWSITQYEADFNPYAPPEEQVLRIQGKVYNNPKFEDGEVIVTSPIVFVDKERQVIVTKSGSEYELGEAHPDYEKAFPQARERIFGYIMEWDGKVH